MTQMLRYTLLAVSLIPPAAALHARSSQKKDNGLVFMHVPYNFGHTIEAVESLPPNILHTMMAAHRDGFHGTSVDAEKFAGTFRTFAAIAKIYKGPSYEPWGHFNADLFQKSSVTGTPLYFTPPKYWPEDVAEKYFGNKTIFGVLRDPYERLVAEFRGNIANYGGVSAKYAETCDINGAVKEMMARAMNTSGPCASDCAYLPQAEYFDGKYGIQVAIDNRHFPSSMNKVFADYGYTEYIKTEDVVHVTGCNDVWAGDMTNETKALVRQVYKRDFELLCEKFGYCDDQENTCLKEVEHMCPEKLFAWSPTHKMYHLRHSPEEWREERQERKEAAKEERLLERKEVRREERKEERREKGKARAAERRSI